MANARLLMPFILKWEGGFGMHPNDRGGATCKGITIGTYRQFVGRKATVEELMGMTDSQWERIFMQGFWNPFNGDMIMSQPVANMCVDWAWTSGTRTAIRQVQRLVGVAADGVAGPVTLAAINDADSRLLFGRIRAARLEFVEAIVRRNSSQRVFLKGWRNRILAIKYVEP